MAKKIREGSSHCGTIFPDPSPVPELGLVLEFMRLIWAVDHALQQNSKRMMQKSGITGPQRLVLRLIGRFPCISAGLLARILHLHPSTLTGIIMRLESRGLIRRRLDPKDRRRSFLGLTAPGYQIDRNSEGTIEAAIRQSLSVFSPEEVETARKVLHEISRTLRTDS